MEEVKSKASYLPSLLSKTRCARIQTEKRLLLYDALAKAANISFACWTAAFSLLSLILPQAQELTFVAICTSVTLAIISAYTSSKDYVARAVQIRRDYVKLQGLELSLDSVDAQKNFPAFCDEVGDLYIELLRESENHTTLDYLISVYEKDKGKSNSLSSLSEEESQSALRSDCNEKSDRPGRFYRKSILRIFSRFSRWLEMRLVLLWRACRSVVLKTLVILSPLAIAALAVVVYGGYEYVLS